MSYLLFLDMNGGKGGREIERRLKSTARRVRRSVWEFKRLPDLLAAVEMVRGCGGSAMAFFKNDEILLHASEVEDLIRKLR